MTEAVSLAVLLAVSEGVRVLVTLGLAVSKEDTDADTDAVVVGVVVGSAVGVGVGQMASGPPKMSRRVTHLFVHPAFLGMIRTASVCTPLPLSVPMLLTVSDCPLGPLNTSLRLVPRVARTQLPSRSLYSTK